METDVETATVSTRGQVCIPSSMRDELGIDEGSKVVFIRVGDSVIMKKASMQTFEEITRPLKEAAKRAGLKESDVPDMIHRFRGVK
jgi:antitoxin PrlF